MFHLYTSEKFNNFVLLNLVILPNSLHSQFFLIAFNISLVELVHIYVDNLIKKLFLFRVFIIKKSVGY